MKATENTETTEKKVGRDLLIHSLIGRFIQFHRFFGLHPLESNLSMNSVSSVAIYEYAP